MGGANANKKDLSVAFELGTLIAKEGWLLLNGGRSCGIMEMSAKGAKNAGGITIGIIPGNNLSGVSQYIDIPILTDLGDARNYINVLSSDIVIACAGSMGTISEIALALKNRRKVILLNFDDCWFFNNYIEKGLLFKAKTAKEAISITKNLLEGALEAVTECQF